MNKPLILTSPDHPFALGAYVGTVFLGLLNVTGLQVALAMTELAGDGWTKLWATVSIIAGIVAWWGAVTQKRNSRNPLPAMRIELVGVLGVFLTQALYEVTLFHSNQFNGVLQTQGYATIFAVVGLWRAVQIWKQMRETKKSIQNPITTNVLAVPHPTDGE